MYPLATLANKNALNDLKVFFFSLQLWNDTLPNIYIFCDSETEEYLKTNPYKGKLVYKNILNQYNGLNREKMELLPGKKFKTLFHDFVVEKTHLMDWVFETEESVLFCDADICFMAPLQTINTDYKLGVSRHNIRIYDEQKYGMYNAGYLYAADKTIPEIWRELSKTSHFFEQACIEDLVKEFSDSYFVFPNTVNYGWWRLLQGRESIETLKTKWTIKREANTCGILIEGSPLLSIHTHWDTKDKATTYFNTFILEHLEKLKSVNKTKRLFNFLRKIA